MKRVIWLYKLIGTNGIPYVGQTTDVKRRCDTHCRRAASRKPASKRSAISTAIRKYGWESFNVLTLGFVLSRKSADIAEKALIDYWRKRGRTYNRSIGGDGGIGWTSSDETRMKQSRSAKRRFSNPLERLRQSHRLKKAFKNTALRTKISKLVRASMTPAIRRKISVRTSIGMRKAGYR